MVSPVLAVFAGLARGATARAEERNGFATVHESGTI